MPKHQKSLTVGKAAKIPAKHVEADLMFWRHPTVDDDVNCQSKNNTESITNEQQTLNGAHRVTVQDIRGQESAFTLDRNGFTYVNHEIAELNQVYSPQCMKEIIIPKTEQLVRDMSVDPQSTSTNNSELNRSRTGASRTITFVDRVRCFATDTAQLANNRSPAHSVHSDFSIAGALHQLSTRMPEECRLLTSRVLIINVWRPLKTIQRDPLAVCDWRTVEMKDRITSRIALPSGWTELGRYAFNPRQNWCYLSGQRPNEPLVFTQFDSHRIDEGGFTVPHTAFVDPLYTGFPARESLEIKMFAFV
ncbi:hypothetical protein N7452_000738 [Penicillium brevicompactum]|uniref:Methyltransferase n=1 Tax=Penicillium brevicompactum TaxID=5074 RepID=A0A9W9R383_PENBR|nr:hypothetical protein N7452_000738 [Penicillium brevicompactum]